eukprot:gene19483-25369_t
MPKPLIKEIAEYCWSNNFLKVFRDYFSENAYIFENAPEIRDGEHNLVYYNCFQNYLVLYENTLTTYIQSLNCSIDEFYDDVRAAKEETTDPYLLQFIECLLASADYESFYKVMHREGLKYKQLNRNNKNIVNINEIDVKADAKASDNYKDTAKIDTPSKAQAKFDYK